jgi:exodeoxyribonuclease VII small subunit
MNREPGERLTMAKQTFENALKQLEKIVQELESGDITLEKSLKKFEEGMSLSKYCTGKLDDMEKRITILTKDKQGNADEVTVDGDSEFEFSS